MTRYTVEVYRKDHLYPDRLLTSFSLGRIQRRMEHLRIEGFSPRLIRSEGKL